MKKDTKKIELNFEKGVHIPVMGLYELTEIKGINSVEFYPCENSMRVDIWCQNEGVLLQAGFHIGKVTLEPHKLIDLEQY
jgi:hypothetical protein